MSDVIPPPPPEIPSDPAIAAAPTSSSRTRSPLVIVGVVVLVLAVLVGVAFFLTRSKGDGTYTANGVTFEYPSSWIHGPSVFAQESGTNVWSETFAPTNGPASVIVTQYALQTDISQVSAADAQAEVAQLIQGLAQDAGGDLTSDVTPGPRSTTSVASTPTRHERRSRRGAIRSSALSR